MKKTIYTKQQLYALLGRNKTSSALEAIEDIVELYNFADRTPIVVNLKAQYRRYLDLDMQNIADPIEERRINNSISTLIGDLPDYEKLTLQLGSDKNIEQPTINPVPVKPVQKREFETFSNFIKKYYKLLLGVIVISLLSVIGFKSCNNNTAKTRVVILLPFPESGDNRVKFNEGIRQFKGIASQLVSNDNIDVVIYNHNMRTSDAKQIVEKEMKNGTKYFLSTMTNVNKDLSLYFRDSIDSKYPNLNPILICSVTSYSPTNQKSFTKKDKVYRLYLRSSDECQLLAESAYNYSSEKPLIIADMNDGYSSNSTQNFKLQWNKLAKNNEDRYSIDENDNKDIYPFKSELGNDILASPYNLGTRKSIFITNYGDGALNIITSELIRKNSANKRLYATSTLGDKINEHYGEIVKEENKMIAEIDKIAIEVQDSTQRNILKKALERLSNSVKERVKNATFSQQLPKDCFVCKVSDINVTDIVTDMTKISFDMLIKTIDRQKKSKSTFDKAWQEEFDETLSTNYSKFADGTDICPKLILNNVSTPQYKADKK